MSANGPTLVLSQPAVEVTAGKKTKLDARVDNLDRAEPETVVLVRGLPRPARLSDGIMIGPGLWLLRADLLDKVQLETAGVRTGRHELTLELRTPEGKVVASARLTLDVAPPIKPDDAAVPQIAAKPVEREQAQAERATASPNLAIGKTRRAYRHARKHLVARAISSREKRVTEDRPAPKHASKRAKARTVAVREASAKPAVRRHARRARRERIESEVTVLSAKPVIRQPAEPRELVWPGDDPRSAYPAEPSMFLGGSWRR